MDRLTPCFPFTYLFMQKHLIKKGTDELLVPDPPQKKTKTKNFMHKKRGEPVA